MFQAYHSQFVRPPQLVGNIAVLPLRTHFKGPAVKTGAAITMATALSLLYPSRMHLLILCSIV